MNNNKLKVNNIKNLNFVLPIFIGLIISLVLNFIINLYIGLNPYNLVENFKIILGQMSNWFIVIILFLIVLFWEKNSLVSLGLKKITFKNLIWGFIGLILGFIIFFISDLLINFLDLVSQSSKGVNLLLIPFSIRLFMVISTGITEEIIFRGYLIERINMLTKSLIFSSIFSLISFTIFHIPFWGITGAFQVAVWAIPITVLYARYRNLTICIIVHILYDTQILIPFIFD